MSSSLNVGEQGLLERFGKPVEGRTVLEAGAHFKWPWPIDKVYRFRTEQIQTFEIGHVGEDVVGSERFILWTKQHTLTNEDNFLVANRDIASLGATNQPAGKRTPPVSLLTGSIPVQFQITNLVNWAYTNEDAASLLEDLGTREVLRYFVSADMNELMSSGRAEAARTLAERIQAAADQYQLGARILAVGLQDFHPPVKIAEDFEKVVAATQTRQAKILAARADQVRTNALSGARAATIIYQANADRVAREKGALAQAALFTNQIPAFQAAPSVYAQRAYLETFTRATAQARKYILLVTNTHDVLVFDLQDKIDPALLEGLNVPPLKPRSNLA